MPPNEAPCYDACKTDRHERCPGWWLQMRRGYMGWDSRRCGCRACHKPGQVIGFHVRSVPKPETIQVGRHHRSTHRSSVIQVRACPRCNGALSDMSDQYGRRIMCVNCGQELSERALKAKEAV